MTLEQLMQVTLDMREIERVRDRPDGEICYTGDYKNDASELSSYLRLQASLLGLQLPENCPDGDTCPRAFRTWWAENFANSTELQPLPRFWVDDSDI